jgi:hypothetical protein
MAISNLVPVYLDNQRVVLSGDPKPRVAKILVTGGKPESQPVVRLRSPGDIKGQALRPSDVIDRTHETNPVYLKCEGSPPTAGTATRATTTTVPVPVGEKPELKTDPTFNPEPPSPPSSPPIEPQPPVAPTQAQPQQRTPVNTGVLEAQAPATAPAVMEQAGYGTKQPQPGTPGPTPARPAPGNPKPKNASNRTSASAAVQPSPPSAPESPRPTSMASGQHEPWESTGGTASSTPATGVAAMEQAPTTGDPSGQPVPADEEAKKVFAGKPGKKPKDDQATQTQR